MTFGWYYEEGTLQGDGDDAWSLIDEAVKQAADDERLHSLRVGEIRDLSVTDFFDEQDVIDLSDDGRLSADAIVECVDERIADAVIDGRAWLVGDDAKAQLRRIVQAHRCAEDAAGDIVRWATEHVQIEPTGCCDGRDPLPIDYVDGEWRYGCHDDAEPAMIVTYASEPSPETGHVGWVWWAQGKMGEATTLPGAMRAAEAALQRVIDDRIAVL